ncbi:hypothetical protein, partial [Aliarcobacter butzleri]|uniref:hypothetical protein n=1 Tax=Aliarcobacter butzleri TaxID=28197 RepID=UPI003B221BB0
GKNIVILAVSRLGLILFKELFINIQTNLKDYSKEELIEVEKFIKEEIVLRQTKKEFEINSKCKIATLKIGNNFAS